MFLDFKILPESMEMPNSLEANQNNVKLGNAFLFFHWMQFVNTIFILLVQVAARRKFSSQI